MRQNFEIALASVLIHEGGYVNHPEDPGGATNKGITWRTYNAWRRSRGQPEQSVRNITDAEVAAIYKAQYWDVVMGDDLPAGVDYAVFDFAVNSGPSRSAKFVQRIVGTAVDGQLGRITLDAVNGMDRVSLIEQLCANRLAWLKRLRTWSTFGRGWGRRVEEVRRKAVALAKDAPHDGQQPPNVGGKGAGPEKALTSIIDTLKDPKAISAIGGAVGSVSAVANGDGPVQWGIAALLVAAAVVAVVLLVRAKRGAE